LVIGLLDYTQVFGYGDVDHEFVVVLLDVCVLTQVHGMVDVGDCTVEVGVHHLDQAFEVEEHVVGAVGCSHFGH